LFEESWRSLAARIAASPSRALKSVIAAAAPHQHPGLEASAAAAFASLWVSYAHWAAADGRVGKPRAPRTDVRGAVFRGSGI